MRENKLSGQINIPLKEIIEVFFIMAIVYIVLSFFGLDISQVIQVYLQYTFSIITGAFTSLITFIEDIAKAIFCLIPVLNSVCI